MTTPIDPGNTAALIAWARTLFDNDYLDVQAIHAYWSDDDQDRYGQSREELDGLILVDAKRMYEQVCPPDCVVVRRDDLRDVLALVDYRRFAGGDAALVGRLRALIGDEG